MSTAHVRDELQLYLDGRLPGDRNRAVAAHLLVCRECRDRRDALKLGDAFGRQMKVSEAPEAIWTRIRTALDSSPRHEMNGGIETDARNPQQQRILRRLGNPRRIAAAIAFFVVSVGAGWTALAWVRASRWEITQVAGRPVVGTTPLSGETMIGAGDWIETDGRSRAVVRVGDIGTTDIAPNSRLRVIAAKPSEHRLALERGSIHARISAPPRLFIVETPTATAIDLGCEYTLDVDSTGASRLQVTLGWVALEDRLRRTLVPMGATAITRPGRGVGIPVYDDASEALHAAARSLELAPEDPIAAAILMAEARRRDAITLWHVLSRVDGVTRARVAMKLSQLVPPPRDVSLGDAIGLEERALDRWLEEIEPAWRVIREPAWKRVLEGLIEYVVSGRRRGNGPGSLVVGRRQGAVRVLLSALATRLGNG